MQDCERDTRSETYAARLDSLESARWKRWLNVQAPYRWNLRRLRLGFVLDVGCGIGRNLVHLDGSGVGVDHNPHSVETARQRGCTAFTPSEFRSSVHAAPGRFDSMLVAHVLEHMPRAEACRLVVDYLRYLKPGGRVVLITPQEAGYRSDPSHVEFTDFEKLDKIVSDCALQPQRIYSFPFPRLVGHIFPHNEFVVVARKQ
jgi:2-polyprenyl-3-methyl-5-hydroxy-6-metoxy-1,4-benzoquinol methylase